MVKKKINNVYNLTKQTHTAKKQEVQKKSKKKEIIKSSKKLIKLQKGGFTEDEIIKLSELIFKNVPINSSWMPYITHGVKTIISPEFEKIFEELNKIGQTLYYVAARSGNHDILNLIFENSRINFFIYNADGSSILHGFAWSEKLSLIEKLNYIINFLRINKDAKNKAEIFHHKNGRKETWLDNLKLRHLKEFTSPLIIPLIDIIYSLIKENFSLESNNLTLLTYNIFEGHCTNFHNNISTPNLPDFILTQETMGAVTQRKDIKINQTDFKLFDVAGSSYEMVGIFTTDNTKISVSPKKITIPTKKFGANRHTIIFDYKNIKIANLHLEGGRFSDKYILHSNMVNGQFPFDEILAFKLQLLSAILPTPPDEDEKPSIIAGDFNSVMPNDMSVLESYIPTEIEPTEGKYDFLNSQFSYFQGLKGEVLSREDKIKIIKLNLDPFKFLLDNGYVYANPSNVINTDGTPNITNGRGSTIIDCFWYVPSKVKPLHTQIINIMKISSGASAAEQNNFERFKCISDHNPVYSQFEII